jgi:hypothetical protein
VTALRSHVPLSPATTSLLRRLGESPPTNPEPSLSREQTVTSNIGQNYPYTSETETERRQAIERLVGARSDLAATLAERTTPLDDNERWWVWKCPTPGCPGRLHVAGYARDAHALVVVCDGTCGRIFQR